MLVQPPNDEDVALPNAHLLAARAALRAPY